MLRPTLRQSLTFLVSIFLLPLMLPAQDSIPKDIKKPLEKKPFESGIFIDNQTVEIPPAKTLEFVLQHRFGSIQDGITDLYGLWGASNIRLGVNFSITKSLLVGFGTTKNKRYQDLSLKYTFLHQRTKGFPLTISYYGNVAVNSTEKINFGENYQFIDRLTYYHEFLFARRFCSRFSMQAGLSYVHFNKVDSGMVNDAIGVSLLARVKVSPQSSILISFQQPFQLNFDPPFVVKSPDSWISVPDRIPYANYGLAWEIATSTHVFQFFFSAAPGIIPQEVLMFNPNNIYHGQILLGFNLTRLWTF